MATSIISVFEHESLYAGDRQPLTRDQLQGLQAFYGSRGVPYYKLIHNGVEFNQHVGVIQVGSTVIEVLPKADRYKTDDRADTIRSWRDTLVGMLRAVGMFAVKATSSSDLRIKPNSILDLYFELFIRELEYLLRRGLVKKYRQTEGNRTALKGSIQFAKHISRNLVHQERFYVRYTTYDRDHKIHAILYKTLKILKRINTNARLNSRIGSLLLDFPELQDLKVSEALFDGIVMDRKTRPYENSLNIARLILLNYHPDIRRGTNNVLALMFDMNALWEKFVYASLRKHKSEGTAVTAQSKRWFWKTESGDRSGIKPDIVLNQGTDNRIVLDTKWKNLGGRNPSPADLRQMFVYMKYYAAKKVALVYPASESGSKSGRYYDHDASRPNTPGDEECAVISVGVNKDIRAWQRKIYEQITDWCEMSASG